MDRLTADVQVSQNAVTAQHGVLQQGTAQVNFDAEIGLDKSAFTPESSIRAKVSLQDASVEELQAILGYSYPISGRVSFAGELGGNKSAPRGKGMLHLRNATVYGETVPSAQAKFTWVGSDLTLEDIDAAYASGHVRGMVAFNLDAGTFRSQLKGEGFELASLPKLRDGPTPVAGHLRLRLRARAQWRSPSLTPTWTSKILPMATKTKAVFILKLKLAGTICI